MKYFQGFKDGDDKVMFEFYKITKEPFKDFIASRFSQLDHEIIFTLFHDSFTVLQTNIKNDKLQLPLRASLKTILFSIGKFKALNHIRDNKKNIHIEQIPEESDSPEIYALIELEHNKKMIEKLLDKIGEGCKKLLTLFYINEMDYSELSPIFEKKPASLRKMKFDCINKIRKSL